MQGKKLLSFILSAVMVLGSVTVAMGAEAETAEKAQFTDTEKHWAAEAISKWADYGVLKGNGAVFRPDAPITRAEMATVLDNIMHYQVVAKNTFSDVPAGSWYENAVLKANAAGVLNGDGRGHATPTANITREQAAAMLARAFAVKADQGSGTQFNDVDKISSWAKETVFGMEAAGYIKGSKGNFNPQNNITRAEVVTIVDNAVKAFYNESGTYEGTVVNGLAIANVKDIVLKNVEIKGNLILAEGIGNNDVTLDGTTVTGDVIVRGGGADSVKITGNSQVNGTVIIQKVGDAVRVLASDGTVIASAEVNGNVVLDGSFKNVTVIGEVKVEVRGTVETLTVEKAAEGAAVTVGKDAKVTTLNVEAPKTELAVAGTITTIAVEKTADGTKVDIAKDAKVETLKNDAKITTSGEGKAKTVTGEGTVGAEATPPTEEGGGGGGGGGPAPAKDLAITISSVKNNTETITPTGKLYKIPVGATKDSVKIKLAIANVKDGNYSVTMSIKNKTTGKEVANADTNGIESKYLKALSGTEVSFDTIGAMFDRIGNSAGWYLDENGTKVETQAGTEDLFKDAIDAMFLRMGDNETYVVTITLSLTGSSDTFSDYVELTKKQ